MQYFLDAFWQIALLRRHAGDLPHSTFLLASTCCAYVLVGAITLLSANLLQLAPILMLVDLGWIFVWAAGVLILFGKHARLTQTLTALLGVGCVLQIFNLPFVLIIDPDREWTLGVSVLGYLLILLWSVAAYGNIIARSIDKSQGVGVMFAAAYCLLNILFSTQLLPAS
jgi:hypothetical protein